MTRAYDVVVYGATGFTGRLVAEYLARRVGAGKRVRWAIAGRNRGKLEDVRRGLAAIDPACGSLETIEASADDAASLERMARSATVVLSTVGPYVLYGEPLVRACVEARTDYVDITGEPDFVNRVIAEHGEAARDRGVRLVSCCGFDSVPHDLGVLFTVRELPRNEPILIEGFVRASGSVSGGTWRSLLLIMSGHKIGLDPEPGGSGATEDTPSSARRVGGVKPHVRFEPVVDGWVVPLPTIDPQIVLRSARDLEEYGPDFRYGHYARVSSLAKLAGLAAGVGSIYALANITPARELLLRAKSSGEGPSEERRARSRFTLTFIGVAERSGKRVVTTVSGGDPGYDETAKIVAESALCLAFDREQLPARAGALTPAVAMGDALLVRLREAGIRFEVKERGER